MIGNDSNFCFKILARNSTILSEFSSEFLREGKALYNNLHPSRIIVGYPDDDEDFKGASHEFASLLMECSEEADAKAMTMGSTEAKSVKLFSNTFLAMRVAFFNELDSFAEINGLTSRSIIMGSAWNRG
ncbi:hypothetical protein PAA26_05080 [Methanomassiliicoccaceae archaeon COG_1]|nr:hypothetical protein [Methanomassiliicoccaceae archaeon COG_1]